LAKWLNEPIEDAIDPDTLAFIARMDVAPTAEQTDAYNFFVVKAKEIGIWNYITDCGFLCGHDAQSSRLGVKDVINLTNVGAGPTHYQGYGFRGNGTNQALDTGYVFPSELRNNASLGVYSAEELPNGAAGDIGNTNSTIVVSLVDGVQACFGRINSAIATAGFTQTNSMGFYAISRQNATNQVRVYKRGVAGPVSGVSEAPDSTYTIWVCGRNRAAPVYSTQMLSYWHIGTGIPAWMQAAYSDLVELTVTRLAASHAVMPVLTPETRSMYRYFISLTRSDRYIVGGFDNRHWPLALPSAPDPGIADETTPQMLANFQSITGELPAILTVDWVDPLGRPTEAAEQLADIKAHYAAGGLISIQQHPGNPVTGTFQQTPSRPGNTGNQYDRTGDPVVACLAGGSKRTEFLAWVDRIIAFLNSCVTDGGQKIPIMAKWMHEIDLQFFWWSDAVPANTVQLWKDFVDRIKAAGVDNVIFDFQRDFKATPSVTWWPGDEYADIQSGSSYDDETTTPVGQSRMSDELAACLTVSRRKPRWFAELGYRQGQSVSDLWSTKTGFYVRDNYPDISGFNIWRPPWGPLDGDSNNASLVAMVADSSCITRSRVSDCYTPPSVSTPSSPVDWWFADSIMDFDFQNSRFRYNGVSYSTFVDLVTAGFASELSGITRITLGSLLPSSYTILARGVTHTVTTVAGTAQYIATLDDGNDAVPLDEAVILTRQTILGQDRLGASVWSGGTTYPTDSSLMATSTAETGGNTVTYASRIALNDFATSFNGAAAITLSTVPMPVVTQLVVGNREDGLRPWGGTVHRIAILSTVLSNAQLTTIW
jgi:hypothetical protein